MGVIFNSGQRIDSIKALLAEKCGAVFGGCGATQGRDLDLPNRLLDTNSGKNFDGDAARITVPFMPPPPLPRSGSYFRVSVSAQLVAVTDLARTLYRNFD